MVFWLALLGIGGITALVWWQRQTRAEVVAHKKLLLTALQRFRYFKMLKFVHVDVDRYLDVLPDHVLRSHLDRCQTCEATVQCDSCLRDGQRTHNLHFCPNYAELIAESRLMPK